MDIRQQIIDLVSNKKKVIISADAYYFMDWLAIDTSDKDTVRLLVKFNTSAFVVAEPTFGSIQSGTGLQEVIIPYNQIHSVEALDASSTLLNEFKNKYPKAYEKWKNAHHVEGVIIR